MSYTPYLYRPRGSAAGYNGYFKVIFDPDETVAEGGIQKKFAIVNGRDSDYKREGYYCGIMDPLQGKSRYIKILRGELKPESSIYLRIGAVPVGDRARYTVTAECVEMSHADTGSYDYWTPRWLLATVSAADPKTKAVEIEQIWKGEIIILSERFFVLIGVHE